MVQTRRSSSITIASSAAAENVRARASTENNLGSDSGINSNTPKTAVKIDGSQAIQVGDMIYHIYGPPKTQPNDVTGGFYNSDLLNKCTQETSKPEAETKEPETKDRTSESISSTSPQQTSVSIYSSFGQRKCSRRRLFIVFLTTIIFIGSAIATVVSMMVTNGSGGSEETTTVMQTTETLPPMTTTAKQDAMQDAINIMFTSPGSYGQKTFYVTRSLAATWDSAATLCQSFGLSFLTFDSHNEAQHFLNVAGGGIWVGFSDRSQEGTFRRVSDGQVISLPWRRGEPNNSHGHEHCVESGYNDIPCSVAIRIACEKV